MIPAAISSRAIILRIRAYVFVILTVLGILWTALLSVDSFTKGGFRSRSESVSIIFFLTSQALTALCIPILILLDHSDTLDKSRWHGHAWFEIAWLSGLFVCQFTAALLFTLLSPSFNCNDANADLQGECQLVNVYISIASWLTPLILSSFLGYLILVCYQVSGRCPGIWRTPVRMGPWSHDELVDKSSSDGYQPSTLSKPRSLEESSNESLSRFDPQEPSLRRCSQSFEPPMKDIVHRPKISAPRSLTVGHGATRVPHYLPPLWSVSRPPPFRSSAQPTLSYSKAMSQLPPRAISNSFPPINSSQYHVSWSSSTHSHDSRRSIQQV